MSCFYCGKRVSLVRKRTDADFCCEEHREKYHARTRRGIEALREVEERMVVTRRLSEGIPQRPSKPLEGAPLAHLVITHPGPAEPFTWMPTGLPMSSPSLKTHIPTSLVFASSIARRNGGAPAPPRVETAPWTMGRVQEPLRPPRSFSIMILLPRGGPVRLEVKQAACEGLRGPQLGAAVQLGTRAGNIARPRMAWRPAANSIGTLRRTAKPPDPVTPPPPSPPIIVTLRNPGMQIWLARRRPKPAPIRMPEAELMGRRLVPPSAAEHPPAPAYAVIIGNRLEIPKVGIRPGSMVTSGHKNAHRLIPCPDSFRRKQYYSSELLERFCHIGFQTIADHRPEIRISAAPDLAAHVDVTRAWTTAQQDAATLQPEGRRPAPPFRERLALPGATRPAAQAELGHWPAAAVEARGLDAGGHGFESGTWQRFNGLPPVCHQGALGAISPAAWARGTAETVSVTGWVRPQTRGAKRTAAQMNISPRKPVYSGPRFVPGRRQAGPTPEKALRPPVYAPASASGRAERVVMLRGTLLPASHRFRYGLGHAEILARGCEPPVGKSAARMAVQAAERISFGPALISEHLRAACAAALRTHPPARQTGKAFDIPKGSPQSLEREPLQRFRRRGNEGLRSRHTPPTWPARSTPRLLTMAAHAPCPHPERQPDAEGAATMFRASQLPTAADGRRACALMSWGRLASRHDPGSSDWGRTTRAATIPLPHLLVLPVDRFGPIRDWGLAPPPEPEQPPEPINEDFAGGMINWICASADWRQDIAGVRTGSLALLRPSLNMSDYEFEFLGKIENQSIGWVFRAANTSNYHAAQVAVNESGGAQLTRYSVVAGERDQPASEALPLTIAKSASCRVKMLVSGDDFKLFLNDQPAAEWSEGRLAEGGVGFFSEGEDRARLYWVKVTPCYEAPAEEAYAMSAPTRFESHQGIRMGV
jgi:hypothetical protein